MGSLKRGLSGDLTRMLKEKYARTTKAAALTEILEDEGRCEGSGRVADRS